MLNIFEFIENKYIQVIFANLYNDTAYGYLYCFFFTNRVLLIVVITIQIKILLKDILF